MLASWGNSANRRQSDLIGARTPDLRTNAEMPSHCTSQFHCLRGTASGEGGRSELSRKSAGLASPPSALEFRRNASEIRRASSKHSGPHASSHVRAIARFRLQRASAHEKTHNLTRASAHFGFPTERQRGGGAARRGGGGVKKRVCCAIFASGFPTGLLAVHRRGREAAESRLVKKALTMDKRNR